MAKRKTNRKPTYVERNGVKIQTNRLWKRDQEEMLYYVIPASAGLAANVTCWKLQRLVEDGYYNQVWLKTSFDQAGLLAEAKERNNDYRAGIARGRALATAGKKRKG